MADNIELNAGAGGDTVAADDVGGVKYQIVKLAVGADGAASLVANANPIPVSDAGGSLTVDGTVAATQSGTWNVATITTVTEVTTITNALPAGTNAIGKLAANSGVDIGDVDVTSMVPGTSATSLGKAEDAAHSSGDTGVAILGVRRDTAASGASTDGDYATLNLDANGRLYATVTVDAALPAGDNNIGNVDLASAIPAGTNNIGDVDVLTMPATAVEDAASAGGETGLVILGVRRDTAASSSGTDGDFSTLNLNASGRLYTSTTVDAALPAGTNNIGDVDVLSVVPGTGASNLGKAEDAAHTSADVGVMSLGVRRDANTSLVDTDGDYAPFQIDANGALKVNVIAGGGTGGTSSTDDAAFTPAVGAGTPIMGFADETTPDSVDEGDVGVVRMTLTRALHVNLRDASGNELSVGGGTQYDEDTAHVSGDKLTMAGVVRADTAASLAGTDGDRTALIVNASGRLYTSATIDAALPAGTNNIGDVDIASALPAGTNNIGDVDVLTLPAIPTGSNVIGSVASITTSIVPGTAATNLGKAEDAAAASGDTGVMVLAVRQDTISSSLSTDGDYGSLKINSVGRLYTSATVDAALPSGTNVIGGITSISTSVVPGTAATNLGKAIDSAVGATDTGVAALVQRNDTPATLTPADGDYTSLRVNSTGALYCYVTNGVTSIAEDTASSGGEDGLPILAVRRDSATSGVSADGDWANLSVDSTGALRVVGSSGTTQYTEDGASAGGESLVLCGGVRQDTISSSLSADGDYGYIKLNSVGRVYTSATIDAALPTGTNSIGDVRSITTSIIPGTSATHLGKAEDAAHASGDTGIAILGVRRDTAASGASADGDYATLNLNSSGRLYTSSTIDAALPAGTNAIGDILSITTAVVPGTGATHLGKAEDAAHSSGDTGVMSLAVRRDANTTLVGADGDYAPLQVNADGSLKVAIISGAGSGGASATDDAAFSVGSGSGTPIMGLADETGPDSVDEGDVGVVRMTLARALHVNLRDASGNELSVGGGTQYDEDAASAGAEKLTLAGTIRQDSITGSTSADGDYAPLKTDNVGRLYVNASGVAVPITDNSGSITVDNAGTFAVQATIAAGATTIAKAEDVASADADVGVPAMAVRKATPANTSGTDGDYEMLQMSAGRLWVDPSGVTLTVASHAVTNAGTFATQVDGAALTALQLIDNSSVADDAAFTPATTGVMVAGFFADETATDSVDEGDAGAARMTLDRKQIVSNYAHTAGGWTPSHTVSAASTNATSLKASAGQVGFIVASNVNAAIRYLKLYNKASAPTVGTDTPVFVLPIPGNTAGAGIAINFGAGMEFTTGIAWALTSGAANSDTGAVSASEHVIGIAYK